MDDDQLRTVGERALLAPAAAPAGLASRIRAVAGSRGLRLREVVPGAATVLVELTHAADLAALRVLLADLGDDSSEPPAGAELSVPVRFDGEDLQWAAEESGLGVDRLIEAIEAAPLTAAFCGFAPGFAYLTGLPAPLSLARRDRPRTRVPAGSFAIAGDYAAIYPRASPGGWRLLGRTDLVMFDAAREPAALISPGTRVRIVAVD